MNYVPLTLTLLAVIACSDISKDVVSSKWLSEEYIIAHCGFWSNSEGVPQNSRASLKRALALKIFGTEFDVRQTKDGILVVNHEPVFNNQSISNSTFEELCQSRLSNGETIPLLEEFLKIWKDSNTKVKLIVDLKSCRTSDVIALVDKYRLRNYVMFISFSIEDCIQLVDMGFGGVTSYLRGDSSPQEIKEKGIYGIDYNQTIYNSHPEYIEEAMALGMSVFVWTVDDSVAIHDFVMSGIIVTTNKPSEFK